MQYGIFNEDGRIITSANDSTVDELPEGAIKLNDKQWERRFDIKIVDGKITYLKLEVNHNVSIQRDIYKLEAEITPRRIRDAVLTDEGKQWLADKDAEIEALRAQL